ncbi:MAG: sugar phosphate isomerase/epimerase [Candidatus Didemnitutus sp.]|nr:sugar phosphate isomerase/epimerase [Candidatus Didemnitutus sp.]
MIPTYSRAFSTLGVPEMNLQQVFALAASHRIEAVEPRVLEGTIELPKLWARHHGTPAAMAATLRDAKVKIVSLDTSFKLTGAAPGDREAFLEFLPWAEALGVPWLRAFDGGKTADAATHREMADTIAWWRELRAKHGWKADLMIETHDALFTAEAIQGFVALAPGTAILWDTHHTWHKGHEDPVETWRAISPHVVHCHVKDSVPLPSARHDFTYVLPGEGQFPMAALREVLAREFTGAVSLEWERHWHPYLPPLDNALRAAAERNWW